MVVFSVYICIKILSISGGAMKRYTAIILLLTCVSAMLAGCGETISGAGRDLNRIGRGVNTVIFREE